MWWKWSSLISYASPSFSAIMRDNDRNLSYKKEAQLLFTSSSTEGGPRSDPQFSWTWASPRASVLTTLGPRVKTTVGHLIIASCLRLRNVIKYIFFIQ